MIDLDHVRGVMNAYRKHRIPSDGLIPAAVLFPLVHAGESLSVLLLLRSDRVDHHRGEVGFPGGRIDPGDRDPLAAAMREAREEIGLLPDRVRILGELDDYVTVTGYHISPFLGVLDRIEGLEPRTMETREVFTVPLAFFTTPGNVEAREIEWKGHQRRVYFARYGEKLIWGATLAMIMRFIEVINDG